MKCTTYLMECNFAGNFFFADLLCCDALGFHLNFSITKTKIQNKGSNVSNFCIKLKQLSLNRHPIKWDKFFVRYLSLKCMLSFRLAFRFFFLLCHTFICAHIKRHHFLYIIIIKTTNVQCRHMHVHCAYFSTFSIHIRLSRNMWKFYCFNLYKINFNVQP